MILKEGGNIFKDPDGKPVTQRISKNDIDPTLDWVEKITGVDHKDMKLGSTGIRSSSGDIDVAVNAKEVDKEGMYQKLVTWATKNYPDDNPRQWVAKSGTNVHFKTPINGNPKNGFVQLDLMFGDPVWMKFALKGSGDDSIYKGAHRMIMLASVAKAQGMQWSPTKGLVDRETKQVITSNPEEIAKRLIGPNANRQTLDSVETINAAIKNRQDYANLVADFKKNIEAQGLPMPEARGIFKGMMLAEVEAVPDDSDDKELDKLKKDPKKNRYKPNIAQRGMKKVGKRAGGIINTIKGGFAAGRASKDGIGAMAQAYKQAGGGRTTIGQIADIPGTIGDKITGNKVRMYHNVKKKYLDVPVTKIEIYQDKGWKVLDPAKKPSKEPTPPSMVKIYRKNAFGKTIAREIPMQQYGKFQKKGWTFQEPEEKKESINEGARIQHIEDLVFFEGSRGAMRALASLRNMATGGHKDVTIKWDGSPAVIFGRDENGEFIFTDKSGFGKKDGVGRAKSPDELKTELLNRGGGKNKDDPSRIAFANKMANVFSIFDRAVPKDFVGFFKGDLLYYDTPKVVDNNFVFKPNPTGVDYAVDVNSDLGKRIARSKTAVVIHRLVDIDGSESPLKDIGMFQGNDLLVVPPMSVETPPEVPNAEVERLAKIIKKDSADIDSLLDVGKLTSMKMKNFPDILYNYVNQSVDRGTLDSLGRDFMSWLMNHDKISSVKKEKTAQYIKQNMKAFQSLWEVVSGIMKVKNNIISQLDSQASSVKASTAGKPGGEGYVLAHPGGDMKLVNRAGFTAANRAAR
tara:strand:- start:1468 stop:3861 length:2394 start_codon:yes stop_codon:yes gene_type:complete